VTDQVVDARSEPGEASGVVGFSVPPLEAGGVGVEAVEDRDARLFEGPYELLDDLHRAFEPHLAQRRSVRADREDWQAVVAGHGRVDGVEGREERRAHVGVEMGHVDSRLERALDLGANLRLHLLVARVLQHLFRRPREAALVVHQRWRRRGAGHRSPPVARPLRGERQVHAEVEFRVGAGDLGRFAEPGTGDHDAAAGGRTALEGLERSDVGGVAHSDVVAVDHGDALGGGESESLGQGRGHRSPLRIDGESTPSGDESPRPAAASGAHACLADGSGRPPATFALRIFRLSSR
jgi:hypothetical protein